MEIPNKTTGNSLTATEFNQLPDELENLITEESLTPSNADSTQVSQALANKAGTGNFYTDSGSVNTYVLSASATNKSPSEYRTGMQVRFIPANDNTGHSTVNVAALGVKDIVNSAQGIISGAVTLEYNGTEFDVVASGLRQKGMPSTYIRAVQKGSAFSIAALNDAAIAVMDIETIAIIDDSVKNLQRYVYDGITFATEGSSLNISGILNPGIAGLTATRVVIADGNAQTLQVYVYSTGGGTWSTLGSSLSVPGMTQPSVAALSDTDFVVVDGGNDDLQAYTFDGATISTLGSSQSITSMVNPSVSALNGTDVVVADGDKGASGYVRPWRLVNSSSWTAIAASTGTGAFSPADTSISALNSTDIALFDSADSVIRFLRTDFAAGSIDFKVVASPDVSALGISFLVAFSSKELLIYDNSANELLVFEYVTSDVDPINPKLI